MKIEQLHLKNFRGFEELEIDFEPDINLFIGENGAGKSSLLDALCIVLSEVTEPLVNAMSKVSRGVKGISADHIGFEEWRDVRMSKREQGGLSDLRPELPCSLKGRFKSADKRISFEIQPGKLLAIGDSYDLTLPLVEKDRSGAEVSLPLIVNIPAYRGPKVKTQLAHELPTTRYFGYRDWTRPDISQPFVIAWIKKYTFAELQEDKSVPQLAAIKQAILDSIPEIVGIDFNVRHDELRFTFKNPPDQVVAYQHLSDGFRNLVTTVSDLAWRAVVLNPHLEERAPAETEGVVLIDEIDQHLHPGWQRRILGALHQAFPRLQIIATTHSPQVIASAQAKWLRKLSGGLHTERIQRAEGLDTNSILEEVMGDSDRPRKWKKKLSTLSRFIHEEKVDKAWKLHDELAAILGEDATELVKARWALDMDQAPRS